MTDAYCGRIAELLESGAATSEQRDIIAKCVLIASCEDSPDEKERAGIKQLEDAIGETARREKGFDLEDARYAARQKMGRAPLSPARLQKFARQYAADEWKAEQAGDRVWARTKRLLGING